MLFQGLINDAKAAVGAVIATYLARASVAVPFVAAAGFATAATTFLLAEQFGVIAACWIVAGGFTAIGAVAALFVGIKEQEQEEAAEAAAEEETAVNGAMEAVEQVVRQSPVELASALLLSTPLGPKLLASGVDTIRRNLPLLVLVVLIAVLFWAEDLESPEEGDAPKPNGADTATPEDHLAPEHLSPEPAYAGWPQ